MNGLNLLLVVANGTFVDEVVAQFKNESATISWKVDCRDLIARIGYLLPNIVILDTNIPGTNPMTVLKSIRSQYPFIKVIMLSETNDYQKAIPGKLRNGVYYVKKPIAIDELIKKIKKPH